MICNVTHAIEIKEIAVDKTTNIYFIENIIFRIHIHIHSDII